jgi:hypothetical protein
MLSLYLSVPLQADVHLLPYFAEFLFFIVIIPPPWSFNLI